MFVLPRPVVRSALHEAGGSDVLPTDVGYFPDAAWHDVSRPEGTSQLIVIHSVRGEGWVRLGGKEDLVVRAGDVLSIGPGQPHAYGSGGDHPWTIYWIHVAGRKTAALHRLLTDDGASPVFQSGEDPETLGLFEEIYTTLRQSYGPNNLLLASLAAGRLLGRLVMLRRRHPESASTRQRIEQTITYMRQRLASHVSVPELARLANLSDSHFAAAFKRQTGYSVLDFFIRLKMQRAAHLLDTTPIAVKAVADELGYEDPLYFSRQFRKVHELSPAQYRAIKKG